MPSKRRKVEQSLKYRWGIVGVILAIGFFLWYVKTSGNQRNTDQEMQNVNLVKIPCIRCLGDPVRKKTCSLCNGYGWMWVDKTREDLPEDVRKAVEEYSP